MFNPIKPTIKTEIIPLLIILIAVLSSFYFYVNFPEKVPMHWNAVGEVDNWGSRTFGAFMMPGVIVAIYLLFLSIPYLDPKKERYEQFRKVYHIFKTLIILYMVGIYFITALNSLGFDVRVEVWIPVMIGSLFMLLGNYMSKIKPNWFMGIRTPWTLSSEEVWNKTHRLGGKLFMLSGIVLMFSSLYPVKLRIPILLIVVIAMVAGTFAYSYLAYNKEESAKSASGVADESLTRDSKENKKDGKNN